MIKILTLLIFILINSNSLASTQVRVGISQCTAQIDALDAVVNYKELKRCKDGYSISLLVYARAFGYLTDDKTYGFARDWCDFDKQIIIKPASLDSVSGRVVCIFKALY